MLLGLDFGSSSIKIAGIENGAIIYTNAIEGTLPAAERKLSEVLRQLPSAVSAIGVTGAGTALLDFSVLPAGVPVKALEEIRCTSEGAFSLTGCNEHLAVNIGTGTSFVLRKGELIKHIGGSAFGAGVLDALSNRIVGAVAADLRILADSGDISNVDFQAGDMPTCPPTLDKRLTMANLVKTNAETSDEDWAAGLVNMVLMTVCSMAYLTANAAGIKTVVLSGGLTEFPRVYTLAGQFEECYGMKFLTPEHGRFCTAIGAALLGGRE